MFFTYHHAVNHPHRSIILSRFSMPLVLKCAARILEIGLQINTKRPKMFLNRDFCMEKLFAREVTIFLGKIKSSKIVAKIHKTNTKLWDKLTRGPNVWIKLTYLPESKVKDFWILSLIYAKSLFRNILDIKFLFVNWFSNFCSTF